MSRAGTVDVGTGARAQRPDEIWAWFLAILLFLTLGVHVWPELMPWRAQTLQRDLPWSGLILALAALVWAGRSLRARARWGPMRLLCHGRGAGLIVVVSVLAALVVLPTWLAASRAGLSLRTGQQWGVPGSPADARTVRRLDFSGRSGGVWSREAFFASISGWLYVPAEGLHHIAVDADADALVEIDGHALVGRGAPPGIQPPGVTDAQTGFRRAPAYLETGFHPIRVQSRHEAGSARLRVRWTPMWLSRAVTIPTEHLLPVDATPREIRLIALALAGRRIGVLGLTCLGVALLALAVTVLREQAIPRGAARVSRGGHAGFGLLFLVLTGAPLLISPEHRRRIAPILLVACLGGLLTAAMRGRLLARRRARAATVSWRGWAGRVRSAGALLALLAVQAAVTGQFLEFVDGRLPLPGDHSSFLYRYHVLLHILPRLRGYDPWWNAGVVDPSPVLSGATAMLALSWPLLALGDLSDVYAAFVPLVGAVVAPWSLFATVRLLGGSRLAALLAGVLVLAPGDVYFWWLMGHGTLPSMVSAALAPLVVALAWRVFVRHDHRWLLVVVLAAALIVGSFWVLFVLMIGPALLIGAAICWRRLRRRDLLLAAALAVGVLLVHSHWLLGILRSPEIGYVAPGGLAKLTWRRFVEDSLHPILFDPNPIALVLGGVGIFLLPSPLRAVYAVFVAALLVHATLLRPLFGRLELDRFFVPLAMALIPPAAWIGARLLRTVGRSLWPALSPLVGAGLLGVLVLHVDGVWRQYSGQIRHTARQIEFEADSTRELVEWIRSSTSLDARLLIWGDLPGPGRLEGGYKAYLQPLTGRPMLGAHQNPKMVDLDASVVFRQADMRGALEAFNVRYVVIRNDHPALRVRLDGAAGIRRRAALSAFLVYEADVRPGYVVGGEGTVAFDYDRVDVSLAHPVDAVTLKFRWVPGLVTDPPLPLDPVEILPGVRFVRVRTDGVRAFQLRYVDCCPWHPVELWSRAWGAER
jgi:hypothetical protein